MARQRQPSGAARDEAASSPPPGEEMTRDALMIRHAAACQRRDRAPLGSDEFRQAAEEVARIEIAIAGLTEGRATA